MLRLHTLLLLFLVPCLLPAQEILNVKEYGVDQGLPQSSVWSILQDDYGFLWVSTADGLCRFDGYTFTTYRNDQDDSLSIGGNTTHLMALDSKGDLWLTHDQGFDKYNAVKGNFSPLYHYTGVRTSIFNKTIGEDTKGFIWVWIGGEGLMKFDRQTNKQVGTYPLTGEQAWRNDLQSRDALRDQRGTIWLSQRSTSLVSFNTVTNTYAFVELGVESGALCQVSDSVLLVGTKKGLIRYNTVRNTSEHVSFHSPGQPGYPETYQTTKIISVSGDEFWVGTNKGIFVYSDKQRAFSKHYTSFYGGKNNYLFVQALYSDRSGNIWIGTNGDGLKKHSPKAVPWKYYRSGGDRGDIVKSIYADGRDLVFAGYFDNGLDVFSKSKGLLRKIMKGQAPWFFPNDMVYSIHGINDSKLFMSFTGSTTSFGIYNYTTQRFQDVTSSLSAVIGKDALAGNHYPVIIPDGHGVLLFNCRDALVQGSFLENKSPVFHLIKRFPNEVINSVFRDSRGTLWVGTLNGYYRKTAQDKEWIKGNTVSKQVKTICEAADGKLWLGTTSGLYIVTPEGIIGTVLKMGDPLVNDFIYGILRDNQDNMWFSHNKGLTRYDPKAKTFRNFSADDGLLSNEFNTGAYFKSASGELFFGGIHGVNSFFPEDVKVNLQIPSVQITRIDVNDKPFESPTVAWAQHDLTLDYTDNTLALEFAGLEFTESVKNQYAWRMSGVDHGWIYSNKARSTRYANIAPGEYRFEVKASNNDGVWNEVPTALSITIIPPFWQKWWFRLLEFMTGTAAVAFIAYMISRQGYRRKLQALEVQQTIQHDRERISRELHDNIGSQLSLISSNLDWVQEADAELSPDERKVRMGNINALSKEITGDLRETIWALNKEEITFSDFTDRLKKITQKLVSVRPEVKLVFRDQGTGELKLKPEEALNLLRICQEAIHNAVKHSAMKILQVRWQSHSGYYEISVNDDGQGFANGQTHKDHYGLENVKKRAAEIGAVADIITSPSGTTVTVSK